MRRRFTARVGDAPARATSTEHEQRSRIAGHLFSAFGSGRDRVVVTRVRVDKTLRAMSSGALFATSATSVHRGPSVLAAGRSTAGVARNVRFTTSGATRRSVCAPRGSLARAPTRARPSAAAAAAPSANRRVRRVPDLGAHRLRLAGTRRVVLAAAAGREDSFDDEIDDDELAALEALDAEGWGDDEDDDEDAMAVAAAVAARAVGSVDGDGDDVDVLGEGDDEGDDEDGVALLRELFEYGGVDVSEWFNLGEDEDIEVSGIANDSRAVLGGDVFVCCVGTEVDGHDYALAAVAAGAVAVVCSRRIESLSEDTPQVIVGDATTALPRLAAAFYGNPSASLTTVGVTGTNGKTTTTHLVRAILNANDLKCGLIGTTGYLLGDVKLTPHGGVW